MPHGDDRRAGDRGRVERRQRENELLDARQRLDDGSLGAQLVERRLEGQDEQVDARERMREIGRASCRERVFVGV